MALDRIFCPIKSSRSSKKSSSLHHNTRQNETAQQAGATSNYRTSHNTTTNNNATNNDNTHVTTSPVAYANTPYRYVTSDFLRVAQDEITVYAGDVVLYVNSSDDEDGKNWSDVISLTRNERGFVPSSILSLEPKRFTQCVKKKLPRLITDHASIDHHHHHHHHQHGRAHSHKTHCTSERTCHSNGGSIKLHQPHHLRMEHTPHFDLAMNSQQGSSGCPTIQKLSDICRFTPPSYCNVDATNISPHIEEWQPFPILYNAFGVYVVTHNFVAREEHDLEVRFGEYVTVLNKDDKDWFWVQRHDEQRQGFVPSRFICPYNQLQHAALIKGNSTMKSSNQNDFHTYINHGPERTEGDILHGN